MFAGVKILVIKNSVIDLEQYFFLSDHSEKEKIASYC